MTNQPQPQDSANGTLPQIKTLIMMRLWRLRRDGQHDASPSSMLVRARLGSFDDQNRGRRSLFSDQRTGLPFLRLQFCPSSGRLLLCRLSWVALRLHLVGSAIVVDVTAGPPTCAQLTNIKNCRHMR
ncbi:hypothetical protein CERZMDRAFT_85277 [Cercospora zeae-maydis SCOH1-5]|uniref:Uncharacterized protein n=1 Tax=Cercospora zeae-maydis SCOH1-5 TaxID=717836 RepID=A0A6A6FDJ3_9PEZI|nr:hypothetical protein CERZMDRAFT_85277 [Cercospora zeae-maydis SCOH1-5]